jgi:hypothetical protein
MKLPYWFSLYVPPVYFLLLCGPSLPVVPIAFLLIAVTTHRYLHLVKLQRARLKKHFAQGLL